MSKLPSYLSDQIVATGYFPAFIEGAVVRSLGDEEIVSSLVHHEATFDRDALHRHVTVMVLTPTRLIVNHTDDGDTVEAVGALSTSEVVPLCKITSTSLTSVMANPARFVPGGPVDEVWLSVGWGAMRRIEVIPASCPDPTCEADHGYDMQNLDDDLTIRMSLMADGDEAVERLLTFGAALQRATTR